MRLVFLLILLAGVYYFYHGRGYDKSQAITAVQATHKTVPALSSMKSSLETGPAQEAPASANSISFYKGRLNFLADYEVTARILGKKYYPTGKASKIAPLDLALGWKRMAEPSVYKRLNISQGNRFYHYRWSNAPPIPKREIISSSANTHIIPASKIVRKNLDDLKEGQVVTLRGYLVHYRESDSMSWWEWKSSLTRNDSGNGSCELMYVTAVEYR